jgi:hypothetical protein
MDNDGYRSRAIASGILMAVGCAAIGGLLLMAFLR